MPVRDSDVAAVAIDVSPWPLLVTAGHGEEGAIIGLFTKPVRQNALPNRREPIFYADPSAHAASGYFSPQNMQYFACMLIDCFLSFITPAFVGA